jgi:hypothetical protein
MSDIFWIIRPGNYTDIDLGALGIQAKPKRVMEYGVSDIGRYLLQPAAIEVENLLIGAEVQLQPSGLGKFRRKLRGAAFWRRNDAPAPAGDKKLFLAQDLIRIPRLADPHLASHIALLRRQIHPLDPIHRAIRGIVLKRVADLRGVCEDECGNRTMLALQGDVHTKKDYLINHLLQTVRVSLPSAQIGEDLFEMRGWAASSFDPDRVHRLLRFHVEGRFFACMLNEKGRMAFWIEELKRLQRLVLLQQALEASPQLHQAFDLCRQGGARAMRLMFNPRLDVDYNRNRLPRVYQELFRTFDLDASLRRSVIESLNEHQMAVSFSYAASDGYGDPRAVTCISVLHDVKALEALRSTAPQAFAAITRMATVSEAGRFYLLEDIQGHNDEIRIQSQ